MEMLKVSAKSARRVKPRRVWLELASENPEDGELGLEVGIGVVGGQDVRLCWEKNGGALGAFFPPLLPLLANLFLFPCFKGFSRSTNYASIPLSRIRDLRFASAGAPYRTSLHLAPNVEPRWVTIIYSVQAPSSFLGSVTGSPTYKLVHFIAPSTHELDLWQKTLESFKEGRLAKGLVEEAGEEALASCDMDKDKVVKEEEVHQLCSRLGMGMSRPEIGAAFRVRPFPRVLILSRS
jgi:phosphatidylinositol phospholipase C delta